MNHTVNAAQVQLNLAAQSATVKAGGQVNVGLNISADGTLAAPVNFACAGLPAGAQCVFSPASVPGDAVPATVTLAITTTGLRIGSLSAPGVNPLFWPATVSLLLPAVFLLPFGGGRRPRLRAPGAAVLLLLLLLTVAGCGGSAAVLTNASMATPAGNFNVTVTATSGNTQASQVVSLTVTP